MRLNVVNTSQNIKKIYASVEAKESKASILRVILDQFSFFFSKTCSGFKWAVSTIFDNRVVEKIKQLKLFGYNKAEKVVLAPIKLSGLWIGREASPNFLFYLNGQPQFDSNLG